MSHFIDIVFCGIPLSCEWEYTPETGDGVNEPVEREEFCVVSASTFTGENVLWHFTEAAQISLEEIAQEEVCHRAK